MSTSKPAGKPASVGSALKELTLRGVIIGGLITLVFTAANVYLGLKVGLTFATSIPAAVISMAILYKVKDHTVQENNIVQTIASSAGTLSAIIFVLPGLVMIGWWMDFPYWTTVLVCALGGILGVMYSIPLRRALVTGSDLPYPEGVAAAEVLNVGDSASGSVENKKGLHVIIWGAVAAAFFNLLSSIKVISNSFMQPFKIAKGGTFFGASLSLALIGVGHLVGITVGVAMLIGIVISFFVLLPIRTAGHLADKPTLMKSINFIFKQDVRFIGAGTIAIAAVWTFFKVIGPIVKGIKESIADSKKGAAGVEIPRVERDLSMKTVLGVTLASMLPIGALLYVFLRTGGAKVVENPLLLVIVAVLFILVIGLAVASVCGYMAGLIGASNSPISGVGILVVITAALVIYAVNGKPADDSQMTALVAYTLFTAAVVFGVATISNDNLQDLKTGQLVEATPAKQQIALVIGVIFGSLVIPPVMNLLNKAFGFDGAPNATENALAAPQASLISSLAKGVFGGSIDWGLLGLGAGIGAVIILIDEILVRSTKTKAVKLALPPLAVGMGMYLPCDMTFMIAVGAIIGLFFEKWANKQIDPERSKRLGTLLATGLIVGESLYGVLFAGIVAGSGKDEPLAIPSLLEGSYADSVSSYVGLALFAVIVFMLYRWIKSVSHATDRAIAAGQK